MHQLPVIWNKSDHFILLNGWALSVSSWWCAFSEVFLVNVLFGINQWCFDSTQNLSRFNIIDSSDSEEASANSLRILLDEGRFFCWWQYRSWFFRSIPWSAKSYSSLGWCLVRSLHAIVFGILWQWYLSIHSSMTPNDQVSSAALCSW